MNKAVIFMGLAIVILLIIISMQLPQVSQAKAELAEAKQLASSTKVLLKTIGIRCTARPNDYVGITNCIKPALLKNDFEMNVFKPYVERTNTTGAFVIMNDGQKTYEGTQFIMSKNGVEVARGCHISGDILPQYTCRFNLTEACISGDVYEISYEQEIDGETQVSRLMTKTC